jgi:hypothetical protein
MEGFLLGDKGPEVFYEVQEEVVKTLQEKFYPSFLVSELYQKMQADIEEASISEKDDSGKLSINRHLPKELGPLASYLLVYLMRLSVTLLHSIK